jgi:putative sugar O-methyltransferase
MNFVKRLLVGILDRFGYVLVPATDWRELHQRVATAAERRPALEDKKRPAPEAKPDTPQHPVSPEPSAAQHKGSVVASDSDCPQVPDDVALLELMLEDQAKQHELYGTTNYYRAYDSESIPYLRNIGLKDFRTKAPSTIASFGAVDSKMPPPDDIAVRRLMYYHAARFGGGSSARPLSEVEISRSGNPEDFFEIDGRCLTPRSLIYYMRYGYVGRYLDWTKVGVMAELGPGVGTQTEVIGQLHPDISVLLFDIPPQLYVCEAYLRAVFGDRVVSYRETRDIKRGFQPRPGKIYVFGNWQLDILGGVDCDLFWSAAALCATEPKVAENYLRIINDSRVPVAYLMENFDGLHNAAEPGKTGVMEKTTMESYIRGLSAFQLIDKSPQPFADGVARYNYDNSIWRRKAATAAVTATGRGDDRF